MWFTLEWSRYLVLTAGVSLEWDMWSVTTTTWSTCIYEPKTNKILISKAYKTKAHVWSGETKNYKIGICCFSAKHAALRRKSKYWLAQNQNNVPEWGGPLYSYYLFKETFKWEHMRQVDIKTGYKIKFLIY
jgi:hypothetical protein